MIEIEVIEKFNGTCKPLPYKENRKPASLEPKVLRVPFCTKSSDTILFTKDDLTDLIIHTEWLRDLKKHTRDTKIIDKIRDELRRVEIRIAKETLLP